ncbi:MAG: hypothetical protein JNL74_10555 [Fibrobacteres bacterium]|nr:hypothetical protein [Fibrobacterota bacterium]
MTVTIIKEAGYDEALLGLSLSYNQGTERMPVVAGKLYSKEGGHNKFLESIAVWLDMSAPRYFWQQFDTYRIGVTKQSESTMHTIMKSKITNDNFEKPVPAETLERLNRLVAEKDFDSVKNELPEGFLQRRIVFTNYMALRRIIAQRKTHKLREWHMFADKVISTVAHPELFEDIKRS